MPDLLRSSWSASTGREGLVGRATPYVRVIRPHWTVASTLAACLGVLAAWGQGYGTYLLGALTVAAAFLSHAFMEVWDEIKDYQNYRMTVHAEHHEPPTLFSGGSGVLTGGHLTLGALRRYLVTIIAVYLLVIAYIFVRTGPSFVVCLVVGGFFIFAYNAGPRLSYRGFGELANAFCFGPVLVCSAYLVMRLDSLPGSGSGRWDLLSFLPAEVVMISVVLGLTWFGSLHVQEMLDYDEDRAGGKRTLVVRWGKAYAARVPFVTAVAIAAVGAWLVTIDPLYLLVLPAMVLHCLETFVFARRWRRPGHVLGVMRNFFVYRNYLLIALSMIVVLVARSAVVHGSWQDAVLWTAVVTLSSLPAALWLRQNRVETIGKDG